MKKILILGIVCVAFASCTKSFECKCTYVPRTPGANAGGANIDETSNVKARTKEFAQLDCDWLDTKYFGQDYDGTCVIQ